MGLSTESDARLLTRYTPLGRTWVALLWSSVGRLRLGPFRVQVKVYWSPLDMLLSNWRSYPVEVRAARTYQGPQDQPQAAWREFPYQSRPGWSCRAHSPTGRSVA